MIIINKVRGGDRVPALAFRLIRSMICAASMNESHPACEREAILARLGEWTPQGVRTLSPPCPPGHAGGDLGQVLRVDTPPRTREKGRPALRMDTPGGAHSAPRLPSRPRTGSRGFPALGESGHSLDGLRVIFLRELKKIPQRKKMAAVHHCHRFRASLLARLRDTLRRGLLDSSLLNCRHRVGVSGAL